MTTLIEPVAREQTRQLILSLEETMLSKEEAVIMNRYIEASISVYSAFVDDQVLGLWGLIPPTLLSDQAYLWLYTTPAAEEHQFIVVRRGQIEVKKMLKTYPKIVGHCVVGAARSIRWLKWMGAVFGQADGKLIPFAIQNGEA